LAAHSLLSANKLRAHIDNPARIYRHRLEATIVWHSDGTEIDRHGDIVEIFDDFGVPEYVMTDLRVARR
jgi:hypothetical protein